MTGREITSQSVHVTTPWLVRYHCATGRITTPGWFATTALPGDSLPLDGALPGDSLPLVGALPLRYRTTHYPLVCALPGDSPLLVSTAAAVLSVPRLEIGVDLGQRKMSVVLIYPGGSDGEEEGDLRETPSKNELYDACLRGTADDILRCLQGDDTQSEYFEDGRTPLHVVALSDREDAEEILDALLREGLDINARTKDGDDTPLHLVITNSRAGRVFPLALKLMEYNPDLFIRNRSLRTPFDNAIAEEHYDLAEVLDGTKTAEEARDFYYTRMGAMYGPRLLSAVLESNMEAIREFVQYGADPNFLNEHGAGAIHYAVTHCTLPLADVLKILVDAGAKVNLKDYEGDTVLNLVVKSERLRRQQQMNKIVTQLLAWGASTGIKDLDGNDAIALARKRDYNDTVDILTKRVPRAETPPPPRPMREPTPAPSLEEEDSFIHPPPAHVSMDQGENDDTLAPLHKAVMLEDPDEREEQIEELLSEGADIDVKTTDVSQPCSRSHQVSRDPGAANSVVSPMPPSQSCPYGHQVSRLPGAIKSVVSLGPPSQSLSPGPPSQPRLRGRQVSPVPGATKSVVSLWPPSQSCPRGHQVSRVFGDTKSVVSPGPPSQLCPRGHQVSRVPGATKSVVFPRPPSQSCPRGHQVSRVFGATKSVVSPGPPSQLCPRGHQVSRVPGATKSVVSLGPPSQSCPRGHQVRRVLGATKSVVSSGPPSQSSPRGHQVSCVPGATKSVVSSGPPSQSCPRGHQVSRVPGATKSGVSPGPSSTRNT
ncbi:hypothetical protein ScPMuIL_008025 [Solemya velum]